MGNVNLCKEAPVVTEEPTKVKNQTVTGRGGVLQLPADCKVRVCVVAYDYHGYGANAAWRLGCVRDGVRFAKMAKDSGAEVSEYYDRPNMNKEGDQKQSLGFPTKKAVLDELRRIGSETTENDAFVFYFAGHGISEERETEEGRAEMMVFMEPTGKMACLHQADMAAVLSEAFPKQAHVLFVTDCFRNGSLCDLSWPALAGRPIVHLAAIKDYEQIPAPASGKGISHIPFKEEPSLLTTAILEAVQQTAEAGIDCDGVSVVDIYNKALEMANARFENQEKQCPLADLVFDRTTSFDPDTFRWPLLPAPGWSISDPLDASKENVLSLFACVR